jgi:hypothetical protein
MSPMPPKPKLQEVHMYPYRFLAPSDTTTTSRHTTLYKTYLVPHALTPRC